MRIALIFNPVSPSAEIAAISTDGTLLPSSLPEHLIRRANIAQVLLDALPEIERLRRVILDQKIEALLTRPALRDCPDEELVN